MPRKAYADMENRWLRTADDQPAIANLRV